MISRKILFFLLLFYIYFTAFEDLFLYILHINNIFLKNSLEIFVYIFLFILISNILIKKDNIKLDKFLFVFLLFTLWCILISIIHYSLTFEAILNYRALTRYIFLFFLIKIIKFNNKEENIIFFNFIIVILLESILSILQFIGLHFNLFPNIFFRNFVEEDSTEYFKIKLGASFGTFSGSNTLGAFLTLGVIIISNILFSKKYKRYNSIFIIFLFLIITGILFSYSKSAVLFSFIFIMIIWLYYNKKYIPYLIIFLIISFLSFNFIIKNLNIYHQYVSPKKEQISLYENLLNLISGEYWENVNKVSRGWTISSVGGFLIKDFYFISGYGLDPQLTKEYLAKDSKGELSRVKEYPGYEDVYWIALLSYVGIFGIFIFIFLFLLILKDLINCKNKNLIVNISIHLIFLAFIYMFVERVLEMKIFSLYFWIFLALAINHCTKYKKY